MVVTHSPMCRQIPVTGQAKPESTEEERASGCG